MSINILPIDSLPEDLRPGRTSQGARVLDAVRASSSLMVRIDGDRPEEVQRLYKSLMQYRRRQERAPFCMRKKGDVLYVWIAEQHQGTVR